MAADNTISTSSSLIYASCEPFVYYDGSGVPWIYVVARVGGQTKVFKASWYDETFSDMGYPASNSIGVQIAYFDGRYIHVIHTPYNAGSWISIYSRYDCYDDTWDISFRTCHSIGTSSSYGIDYAFFPGTETFDGVYYCFYRLYDDKKGYHQVRWAYSATGLTWTYGGDLTLVDRDEAVVVGAFIDTQGIIYLSWWPASDTTYYRRHVQAFAEGAMLGSENYFNNYGQNISWHTSQHNGRRLAPWLPNQWLYPYKNNDAYYTSWGTYTYTSGSSNPLIGDQRIVGGSPAYHSYSTYPDWLNTSGSQLIMMERSNIDQKIHWTKRNWPSGGWSSVNSTTTLFEQPSSVNGIALRQTPVDGYVAVLWSGTNGLYLKCYPSVPANPFLGGESDGLFLF